MIRKELLKCRGFADENELITFLKTCADKSWKKELIEFYAIDLENASDTDLENKKSVTKSKKNKQRIIEGMEEK